MKRILILTLSLAFLLGSTLLSMSQTKATPMPTPAETPVAGSTISVANVTQTKVATIKRKTVVKRKKQPNYEYLAYLEAKKTRESQERTEADIAIIKKSQVDSTTVLGDVKTMLTDFTGFAKPLLTKIDLAITSISAWTGYTYAVAWWFVAALIFIATIIAIYGLFLGIRRLIAWNNTREPFFAKRGLGITS